MDGPIARPLKCALPLSVVVLAGCGGSDQAQPEPTPKPKPPPQEQKTTPSPVLHKAAPGKVRIVKAWADALRTGHVDRAASYFSVPAIVQNGTADAYRLTKRKQVRAFNITLPCGAVVVKAQTAGGRYTIVTFKLTERKGSPSGCGSVGRRAATAFAFRHGKISEWLRVVPPEEQTEAPPA